MGAPATAQTFLSTAVLDAPAERKAVLVLPTAGAAGLQVDQRIAALQDADRGAVLIGQMEVALRGARRNREGFRELLEMKAAYPSMELSETPVGMAVEWSLIAADDDEFTSVIETMKDDDDRRRAHRLREALLAEVADAASEEPGTRTTVFADGSIRGTGESEGNAEAVGTGALAVAVQNGRTIWYASVNIASTEDTVDGGFGPALLAPGSGKALSSGLVSLLAQDVFARGWGLQPYISTSRHLWSVEDTARSATVLGAGLLLHREVAVDRVENENVSVTLQIGPTLRWLGGDIMGLADTTRQAGIGTDRAVFGGVEAGASITVGDLVGALHLYYMGEDEDQRVLGLSGLQMVAGFSVKGRLFGAR